MVLAWCVIAVANSSYAVDSGTDGAFLQTLQQVYTGENATGYIMYNDGANLALVCVGQSRRRAEAWRVPVRSCIRACTIIHHVF